MFIVKDKIHRLNMSDNKISHLQHGVCEESTNIKIPKGLSLKQTLELVNDVNNAVRTMANAAYHKGKSDNKEAVIATLKLL